MSFAVACKSVDGVLLRLRARVHCFDYSNPLRVMNYLRASAFLNPKRVIILLSPFLARFSSAIHYDDRISHTLLSSVRSTSHVELLSHILAIARLLVTSLLVPARCTHRLSLVMLLGLIESNHLSLRICFYFRIVDDEVIVVVIRDDIRHYFRLPISLRHSLVLLLSLVRP